MSRYRPHTIVTVMPANTTQRAAKNSRKFISSNPTKTARYDPRRLRSRPPVHVRYARLKLKNSSQATASKLSAIFAPNIRLCCQYAQPQYGPLFVARTPYDAG
jgi:hypothetical protein